jgi:hypothetical protein
MMLTPRFSARRVSLQRSHCLFCCVEAAHVSYSVTFLHDSRSSGIKTNYDGEMRLGASHSTLARVVVVCEISPSLRHTRDEKGCLIVTVWFYRLFIVAWAVVVWHTPTLYSRNTEPTNAASDPFLSLYYILCIHYIRTTTPCLPLTEVRTNWVRMGIVYCSPYQVIARGNHCNDKCESYCST